MRLIHFRASVCGQRVCLSQISVVLSTDKHHLAGLVVLLQSLWQHTSHIDRLWVYIAVVDMTPEAVRSYLACHRMKVDQVLWYMWLSAWEITACLWCSWR